MKNIEVYCIYDLLRSDSIRFNKSSLSKVLDCTRGTILKYQNDRECDNHFVTKSDGKFKLFTEKHKNRNDKK